MPRCVVHVDIGLDLIFDHVPNDDEIEKRIMEEITTKGYDPNLKRVDFEKLED